MFTGPVGPVEVLFYWTKAILGNFYWPGAIRTTVSVEPCSLFHTASVYPATKWVPGINKAVLRACALYAASCSGIYPRGLKWFPCVQAC